MTKQDSHCHTLFTAVKIMKDIVHKFINLSEEGIAFIFRAENAYPDDGGNNFLWDSGRFVPVYTASYPSRAVFFLITPVRSLTHTYC